MRKKPVKIGGREINERIDAIEAKVKFNRKLLILHSILLTCAVCAGIIFLQETPMIPNRRKVRRGDNLRFIASYLFVNPFAKPAEVRKALVKYNRIPYAHHSHYSEYVYNNCGRKPPYEHLWARATHNTNETRGLIQLQLTTRGMGYVDLSLADRIQNCDDFANLQLLD